MYGMKERRSICVCSHRKTPLYHADKEGLALSLVRGAPMAVTLSTGTGNKSGFDIYISLLCCTQKLLHHKLDIFQKLDLRGCGHKRNSCSNLRLLGSQCSQELLCRGQHE